jgi:hypothetical protein
MRTLVIGFLLGLLAAGLAVASEVAVSDTGDSTHAGTWECTPGHQIRARSLRLSTSAAAYRFAYSGCTDPSHGEEHPSSEGNFGMPEPTLCNFYHSGFMGVLINGKDAVRYTLRDARPLESGARGSLQLIFAHPDADVGLRLLMLPDGNHVLALLSWRPRAGKTVDSVRVWLTCYPSFFTAARNRQGERHVMTPRTDEREPETLTLVPAEDTWLFYHDRVFDVAKGEGEGPCATLLDPVNVQAGRVMISDYAVRTELDLNPQAGEARLAFYDFKGQSNADAEAYLRAHGAADLAELAATDFHPQVLANLDLTGRRAEAERLLTEAAEDGQALRGPVDDLFARLADLQQKATRGDWSAEADVIEALRGSEGLFYRLRIFAALNRP